MDENLIKINLNEESLSNIMTIYSENGYLILSVWDGDENPNVNKLKTKKLEADIKQSQFSFFPVWSAFKYLNSETGTESIHKEKNYVVTNFKKGTKKAFNSSKLLKKFGLKMIKKYNRPYFFYHPKQQSKNTFLLNKAGKPYMSFKNVEFSKDIDNYFISLNRKGKKNAFSFKSDSIFIAKAPTTITESYERYGEIFFK